MEEHIIVPIPLYISVHEDIHVSEWWVVGVIVARVINWDFNPKEGETLVSIAEYRSMLGNTTSNDEDIARRLQYLEAYCRNIIKLELQSYGK
jgi:hypothetical protein